MSEDQELEPGQRYLISLAPQQLKQLVNLISSSTELVRLRTAVAKAEVRKGLYEGMPRAQIVKWIAEQIMEAHGDLVTLEEQYRSWVRSLKGTAFASTGQSVQVSQAVNDLSELAAELFSVRKRLLKVVLPGGYREAEGFASPKTRK
jgi:hypothetical protein